MVTKQAEHRHLRTHRARTSKSLQWASTGVPKENGAGLEARLDQRGWRVTIPSLLHRQRHEPGVRTDKVTHPTAQAPARSSDLALCQRLSEFTRRDAPGDSELVRERENCMDPREISPTGLVAHLDSS